jgi:hypothetical protein
MPLYMDIHHISGGVACSDVAGQHDVRYLRYWVDEQQGTIFCLVEAPSAGAAAAVHQEAHGLLADEILQVQEGT